MAMALWLCAVMVTANNNIASTHIGWLFEMLRVFMITTILTCSIAEGDITIVVRGFALG